MSTFIDHSADVLQRLQHAKESALVAMAVAARQLIQDEIMSGYGDPIWDTGNLHGSIAYDEPSKNSIHVGTNVEYAGYVHDGTYKMQERPFIRSALAGAQTALEQVAEQALRRSMG